MSRLRVFLASSLVVATGGVFLARRHTCAPMPDVKSPDRPGSAVPAAAVASYDPTWCGKPLGANAAGQLRDPSTCTKISLTGSAPTCFFWADCDDIHFQVDCSAAPGRCRCDGEGGQLVPYDAAFCTLDREQPGAGLRGVLSAVSKSCRWSPR